MIESLGAKAIATTSAAVDWTLGYPDGNVLPIDKLAELTRNIARVITVPLSVDFEAGYSDVIFVGAIVFIQISSEIVKDKFILNVGGWLNAQ